MSEPKRDPATGPNSLPIHSSPSSPLKRRYDYRLSPDNTDEPVAAKRVNRSPISRAQDDNRGAIFEGRARLNAATYLPPSAFVDQPDVPHTMGATIGYPKCFHCGNFRYEECKAPDSDWQKCKLPCYFCKDQSHQGEVCPRLWCTAAWWKRRLGNRWATERLRSLRPSVEEGQQLISEGHDWFQTNWKPLDWHDERTKQKATDVRTEEVTGMRIRLRLAPQEDRKKLEDKIAVLEAEVAYWKSQAQSVSDKASDKASFSLGDADPKPESQDDYTNKSD